MVFTRFEPRLRNVHNEKCSSTFSLVDQLLISSQRRRLASVGRHAIEEQRSQRKEPANGMELTTNRWVYIMTYTKNVGFGNSVVCPIR